MKFTLLFSSDSKLRTASFLLTLLYLFSSTVIPAFAAVSYSYDANGNMSSDGTNCNTYNDANQLTQVKNCSTGKLVATYAYDYQGNRIARRSYDVNGNLVKTTYTPTQSYETVKLASNSAIQNTAYYHVNDKLVARKNPDNSKTYYLSDNLNSVSGLTDQSGNVIEKTAYYPFGAIRSGGTQSKQLYTGQINDPETGLDYYNARYYSSHIARFTQPDTVVSDVYNPQQLNRYSYVSNNPLTYNDPSGHCLWDACIVEGIGVYELAAAAIASYFAIQVALHPAQTTHAFTSITSAISTSLSNTFTNLTKNTLTVARTNNSTGTSSVTNKILNNNSTPNNSPKIPNMNPLQNINPAIPAAAATVLKQIRDNGSQALEGYSSGVYKNISEPFLPESGTYMEHDIEPFVSNATRGLQRLVIDTVSGKAWYTPDHYKTWAPIGE